LSDATLRIREELSGNLCRCTGYVGIVEAIRAVSLEKTPAIASPVAASARKPMKPSVAVETPVVEPVVRTAAASLIAGTSIEERIPIKAPPDMVWLALSDLRRVAPARRGDHRNRRRQSEGTRPHRAGSDQAGLRWRATVTMDATRREGRMVGRGRDSGIGSSAEGEARWQVIDGDANDSVIVVNLNWRLTGPLAQFNRSGLIQDVARRLALAFAINLEAAIDNRTPPVATSRGISAFGLFWSIIKARLLGS
jgi:carbon monoxide dehydrogenase subunit G